MNRHIYRFLLFFIVFNLLPASVNCRTNKLWVVFTDKADVEFNPYEYFDEKAIIRRQRQGVELFDYTDKPVSGKYVDSINRLGFQITGQSRWLNAVSVKRENNEKMNLLEDVSFVKEIVPMQAAKRMKIKNTALFDRYSLDDLIEKQLSYFEDSLIYQNGLDGTGVRIAVFDAGFPGVDDNPQFAHLRDESRVIKTYDFVRNCEDVYHTMSHGTMVLSCIAGKKGEQKMGLATGAEFLLARTETFFEWYAEEENWVEAMEWADKNGADIINSSLGYTYHRYFEYEMDGKTTLVAKAANIAARKGMLVVNSMGNEGNSRWEVLGSPADADSVLSVGAIHPYSGYHIYFSSFGPTSDFRLKPNLTASGLVAIANRNRVHQVMGTSFSAPLLTGFAACMWQLNSEYTNMKLFKELEKSGKLYPYFDYAHGYGVPKASYFIDIPENSSKTFTFDISRDSLKVRVVNNIFDNEDVLYYHFANEAHIVKYNVLKVEKPTVINLSIEEVMDYHTMRVHYKGYTDSLILRDIHNKIKN